MEHVFITCIRSEYEKVNRIISDKLEITFYYNKHASDLIPVPTKRLAIRSRGTYVSKQMGANREQRNVLTWGWQSVCTRCCQVVDFRITSAMLVCPIRLGSLISEYPISWHMSISSGISTHLVDNPMSKPFTTLRKPLRAKTSIFAINNIF